MDYPALESDLRDFCSGLANFNNCVRNRNLLGAEKWMATVESAKYRFWTHMGGRSAYNGYAMAWNNYTMMVDAEINMWNVYKNLRVMILFPGPRRSARLAENNRE